PIKDWESHNRAFESRKRILNESQFEALHFTNSRGTDLLMGLPENHVYIGGGVIDRHGIPFFPNIPTEEIFTAPHKNKANGKLVGLYVNTKLDKFLKVRFFIFNWASGI